jgi:hypothetical protein
MRSSVRRVDVLDAGPLSANSRKTGARRPCATFVLLKTETKRRVGELGPLDGQRRLMDKAAKNVDRDKASAIARNAQGILTASIGLEMERLQVVALLGRPRQ